MLNRKKSLLVGIGTQVLKTTLTGVSDSVTHPDDVPQLDIFAKNNNATKNSSSSKALSRENLRVRVLQHEAKKKPFFGIIQLNSQVIVISWQFQAAFRRKRRRKKGKGREKKVENNSIKVAPVANYSDFEASVRTVFYRTAK